MTEPTLSPIGPDPGARTVGSATDRLGELDARQLKEKLVEAELLLNYAVATGRQVEGAVISENPKAIRIIAISIAPATKRCVGVATGRLQ